MFTLIYVNLTMFSLKHYFNIKYINLVIHQQFSNMFSQSNYV
jgi:hypothetical protein